MEPTGARVRRAGRRHPPKFTRRQKVEGWFLNPGGDGKVREVIVNRHVVGFDFDDGQWFAIRLIRRIGMAFLIRFDRHSQRRQPKRKVDAA